MNPDKQRIAIAEYCGTDVYINDKLWDRVPDYLNDLNAMHEAEKTIPKRYKCIYANHLTMVVGFDGETDMVDDYGEWSTSKTTSLFSILNATATQKAEAFLKTIGKWEE
jgi:hypothetical protein